MLVNPVSKADSFYNDITQTVSQRYQHTYPELFQRLGDFAIAKCIEDNNFHLGYLIEASDQNRPEIFTTYLSWLNNILINRGLSQSDLIDNISILQQVLSEHENVSKSTALVSTLEAALSQFQTKPRKFTSYIEETNPYYDIAKNYLNMVLNKQQHNAVKYILSALDNGISIQNIYLHVFQVVQREIGLLWQSGKISVAVEHYCTAVTQLIISNLYPRIFSEIYSDRSFIAASIGDELHEIGIRMVTDFIQLSGWNTIYLGANLPDDDIINSLIEHNAEAIALSATMPFYLGKLKSLINKIRETPAICNTFIMVGGYAFNEGGGDWKHSGADAYAPDAQSATDIILNL